jgi:hypothetical protein
MIAVAIVMAIVVDIHVADFAVAAVGTVALDTVVDGRASANPTLRRFHQGQTRKCC